jgi:hypothetical protein
MHQLFLMSLMERFTHFCRTNGIQFWIDWGTLLGQQRCANIILWDYDIDVCMLVKDYTRLIQLGSDSSGLCLLPNYYDDPDGCLFISDSSDNPIGIDVVCYSLPPPDSLYLINHMSEKVIGSYPDNYTRKCSDVFPLRTVPFCGNYVNIPNNPIEILKQCYGDDFRTIPAEYQLMENPDRPFRKVALESDIKDRAVPYILRNCKEFTFNTRDLIQTFSNETNIWGYTDIDKIEYEYVHPEVLIKNWEQDQLNHSLVDTECSYNYLLPEALFRPDVQANKCYTLTKRNNLTPFHIDPDYGAGWMYLSQGCKLWWFISPEDMAYLGSKNIGVNDLKGKSFTELIIFAERYLWGKIYLGEIHTGDFLYFPKKWAHQVVTYEKSIGLSGYV